MKKQPIYDHRTVVGHAKTPKQAEKLLRERLQHTPKARAYRMYAVTSLYF